MKLSYKLSSDSTRTPPHTMVPELCFTALPIEVLDSIICHIREHCDLISLALSSKACSSLVLPHHAEYRTLRLAAKHHGLWAHLAQRRDLAKNVNVLYLTEDPQYLSAPERYPVTLLPGAPLSPPDYVDTSTNPEDEKERALNIALAIHNMTSLHKFVWVQPWASGVWLDNLVYYDQVFRALSLSCSLRELNIVDTTRDTATEILGDDSPVCLVAFGALLCIESDVLMLPIVVAYPRVGLGAVRGIFLVFGKKSPTFDVHVETLEQPGGMSLSFERRTLLTSLTSYRPFPSQRFPHLPTSGLATFHTYENSTCQGTCTFGINPTPLSSGFWKHTQRLKT